MRVKEPSKALPEKAKRSKRPAISHDEDSSDDIAGFTCEHVSHAVSVNHVKRAIAENLWSVCSECLKERRFYDGQPVLPSDIWLCLKCGFQGCGKNSDSQHSLKHFKSWRTELHCIIISLSTWIIWCYECDEKLSTHCNKKVLAQIVDFLQKHVSKTQTRSMLLYYKSAMSDDSNLAQSYILTELMNEIKENGTKLKIFPSSDSQLDPLMVELSSPGPLTSALFLFLHSMKETEKGPLSPKVLFNQLCQKAPRFKSFQQQDSQELLHYLLDAVRTEETKVSKPVLLGRMSKYRSLKETDTGQFSGTVTVENTQQPRATKKPSSSKDKNQLIPGRKSVRKLSSGEDKAVVINQKNGNLEMNGESSVFASIMSTESALTESPTDGSEKEGSRSESSVDADSEASESESASKQNVLLRSSSGCHVHTNGHHHHPSASEPPAKKADSGDEGVAEAISELHLSSTVTGDRDFDRENQPVNLPNNLCFSEEKHMMSHSPQNAFQTLSQSYITTSKECSVQSCLYQFTSMELLMGNNKLLCENCTEKKRKYQGESSTAEKKAEGIYTNARKQLLISAVPAILILHLKRFHQAGLSLRKVNRHVDFPLTLDLAPFCSATCKNVSAGEKVLYGLYGIVEHSGSMRGGHYTAYVKVRAPSWKLLEHITGKKNVSGLKEPDSESAGQWVHVSDTYVQAVPESRALSAQAYLLFYERIF
ncbi:PREDICTED: ubiquitin carboxyl-terminal hydrolase 45 [Hipposideros armiger]|uniref:ubiquitinyl hydrolase 1 n=1 Tax=Hipposideros armiger TaxID=186990 RepID=A0A8B7RIE5_HIPAR|nr:PREDICTED: ubiquitin carboxyl-terminal hydrolase 45 [Hipposideros armiger]